MRLFIALELSKEVLNQIKKIQYMIKKKNLFNGKFTESENLHLTLKFLGEVNEEKINEIRKKLNEIEFTSFNAEIGEIGVFSRRFPKIIWVKLNGKGVYLQKKIDENLNNLFRVEERFMSHITIARVKTVGDRIGLLDYLEKLKTERISFNVDKFVLKKSELFSSGPVYSDVEEFYSRDYRDYLKKSDLNFKLIYL